ncbi:MULTISPECIES: hypothetical protein [Caulobacter]|uniref:Uncharacterized protein n=1 Tax=Caulobacter vibrioides OR37 TaxID=1292034 RepID=R0EAW8_CAUVI|nr:MULTISPECIES: hypothetical protein [Caulobacter]ENZ82613.1 hypothetical protein OR37_01550 [Caulobacter vibrioides OR37]MBQ1563681.1 hypothetical protein [Caulobacter sp.]
MPFDDEISSSDPEATTTLLRHVIKAWGREHGIADAQLPNLVHDVLGYVNGVLRDGRFAASAQSVASSANG